MIMKVLFTLFIFALFILLTSTDCNSQVNAYAEVTAISGMSFAVTNEDETYDTFTAGEQVVIMQMQDSVLGNASNSSNFGSLGSIQSAGLYEIRAIDYVVRSGGNLNLVVLSEALNNTYNINSNSSVQLITFPTLDAGSGNYTTTANISAVPWDGNIGGVAAFNVDNILTLNHNISADNAGFQGALANGGGSTGCSPNSNYSVTTQNNHADKGEGIFLRTAANQAAGRGKIINGGGGGNSHNAGGGGGGNYTAGGDGGPGWNCSPTAGGIGGIDLSADISSSRIFMGGGGGSGEGNNSSATGGGNGGGIILLKAGTLVTSGSCAGRTISSNGESITTRSSNDGSGGGGAGGSIILQIDSFSVSASCNITVEANGGDGGTVGSGAQHGGGGGGGQGVVIYSSTQPTSNVTTNANNGAGGCNTNSNPCTTQASGGSGTDGSGIIDSTIGPLPIELLMFDAKVQNDVVFIWWQTASEINNEYFEVQKSVDLISWEIVGRVNGSGNSIETMKYSLIDADPTTGYSYYELRQVDFDGKSETFKPAAVLYNAQTSSLKIFPIPADDFLMISDDFQNENLEISIYNIFGNRYLHQILGVVNENTIEVEVSELPRGLYILKFKRHGFSEMIKFYKN